MGVQTLRNRLWYEQRGICGYCDNWVEKDEATYEHIVPVKHGGPRTWGNGLMVCDYCNCRKGDMVPHDIAFGWVPPRVTARNRGRIKRIHVKSFLSWLEEKHAQDRNLQPQYA